MRNLHCYCFLGSENKTEVHVVKFLPPIALNFQLPKDYPSFNSPQFTLSCKWLNRKQVFLSFSVSQRCKVSTGL